MTIVATEDTRNLAWRNNNIGANLLQKMGWQEGEGIGKRAGSATALRAMKRQDGLGIGAKMHSEGGKSESTDHFAAVLANLQTHHEPEEPNKKSKKTKLSLAKLSLPQNKVTAGHAQKMRAAKFGEKSAEDMACIFGNRDVFLDLKGTATSEEPKKKKKKRAREVSDGEPKSDDEKKSKKKRRKDGDEKEPKKSKKQKDGKKKNKKDKRT
jgi:hypothetical protein